jgi:hypothetical protein
MIYCLHITCPYLLIIAIVSNVNVLVSSSTTIDNHLDDLEFL